jgi:nucleoside diphosphate kinase/adenylate kinase family enzyme
MSVLTIEDKEKSLLIVKPHLAARFTEISGDLDTGSGDFDYRFYIKVIKSKTVYLSEEKAWDFFQGYNSSADDAATAFDALVTSVAAGPCIVAAVEHLDGGAVDRLKEAVGQLNVKYGEGAFHCSGSKWEALREVDYFFPYVQRLPVTTTLVVASSDERAEQAKLACWDQDLLVIAEAPIGDKVSSIANASEFTGGATALLVEGRGAVEKCQLMTGPLAVPGELHKAPGSLRFSSTDGGETKGFYSSPMFEPDQYAAEQAMLEPMLAFQQTLLIVKPDAMAKLDEIVAKVEEANFTVLEKKVLQLSEVRATSFFESEKDKANFPSMIRHMCSAPMCALVVARTSAVFTLQQLCGPAAPREATAKQPKSLRAVFGVDLQRNGVYCSSTEKAARKDIAFFFPYITQNPLPDREETQDFLLRKSVAARSTLTEVKPGTGFDIEPSLLQFVSKGLVSLCQENPHGDLNNIEALQYLSQWLVSNNPNKPVIAEPTVEVPVMQTSEGVPYTVEEPAEEAPMEVVEVDVSKETTSKFMAEFEAPPNVCVVLGEPALALEIAEASEFKLLDLDTMLQDPSITGSGELGKKIQRCLAGGDKPSALDPKLKLPVIKNQMLEHASIGRFVVSGLTSLDELKLLEQEVTEVTIVLTDDVAAPAAPYYSKIGKLRVLSGDKVAAATDLLLPQVLYCMAPVEAEMTAVCEGLEQNYGFCHINVPSLLNKLKDADTSTGKAVKAALEAAEPVHESIVGPEMVAQMQGALRYGFTKFVLCGFPRTEEELRFFESQVRCKSEALVLEYSRSEAADLAAASTVSQEIAEKTVGLFYGQAQAAVVKALESGPQCQKVSIVAATADTTKVMSSIEAIVRPQISLVLGPPGAGEVLEFASEYATSVGAVCVDMDALLDAELERKTESGVQMANMLARGQVVPVRMIIEVINSASRWTNTKHLVLLNFPRYLDEAELLLKVFDMQKVIFVQVGQEKYTKLAEESTMTSEAMQEHMSRTQQVATFFAAQGLLQKIELTTTGGVPKLIAANKTAGRPSVVGIVGMPFVGKTTLAEGLKSRFGFAIMSKADISGLDPELSGRDLAVATVDKIIERLDSETAPGLILDDLLTDHETYMAYEEKFGSPPLVLQLVCGEEEMQARKQMVLRDDDPAEADERIAARKMAMDPDMEGGNGASHYLNAARLKQWTADYFKLVKQFEAMEATETAGSPSKEFLKLKADIKEAHSPSVQKIEMPDLAEGIKSESIAAMIEKVAAILKPEAHVVVGPKVRNVSVTVASALAIAAAGKQVVLDAAALLEPHERYSASLNATLKSCAALGEPILPDVWGEVFAERLKDYAMQHVFIANFPGESVRSYPTVRDEMDVLGKFAVVKGVISTQLSEDALKKYCFKGAVEPPTTAVAALSYYRGNGATDADTYKSTLEEKVAYLGDIDMDRENWMTYVEIGSDSESLTDAARTSAQSTLELLKLL